MGILFIEIKKLKKIYTENVFYLGFVRLIKLSASDGGRGRRTGSLGDIDSQ
jgi:hypothetical protein